MQATRNLTKAATPKSVIAGRVISTFVVLMFTMDGVMKLFKPAPVIEATVKLGYPESSILTMGLLLLLGTVLYSFRKTSVLGAIVLTGYLGGAVATHVRVEAGAFNSLFPVVFGALAWLGLWLRDEKLRNLIPLRGTQDATVSLGDNS